MCGQYRLIGINGQISVFDQGMTGGRGLLSKFVSIIGRVAILVPCSRSPIGLACSVLS